MARIRKFVKNSNNKRKMFVNLQNLYRTMIVDFTFGRIVGESAALLYTAGSSDLLPVGIQGYLNKIFESGGTLTIQLYLSATRGEYDVAFGIAVVLLLVVLGINFITKLLTKRLFGYEQVAKADCEYPFDCK